jgi:hypothetical protein
MCEEILRAEDWAFKILEIMSSGNAVRPSNSSQYALGGLGRWSSMLQYRREFATRLLKVDQNGPM